MTEKELPAGDAAYEDVTHDGTSYTVKVYVGYEDGALAVTNLELHKNGTEKTDDPAFVSEYDPAALTITKKFDGNQAVATDTFTFNVNIKGKAGEEYVITLKNAEGGEVGNSKKVTAEVQEGATDATATAQVTGVGKGYKIEVTGLSDTDTYTITEDSESMKGYTSSWKGNTLTGNIKEDKSETVTNIKNGVVPTGIILTAAPYAAIVALGGVFAGLFFRRKRED